MEEFLVRSTIGYGISALFSVLILGLGLAFWMTAVLTVLSGSLREILLIILQAADKQNEKGA